MMNTKTMLYENAEGRVSLGVMQTNLCTHNLGYPRIGPNRELKKATEAFWRGELSVDKLKVVARGLRERNWTRQQALGLDWIPCNDFSFYDAMLDLTCLVGNVPPRFGWEGGPVDLDLAFRLARGTRETKMGEECSGCKASAQACDMTKWFDTNYHYIVPEFHSETRFRLSSDKIFEEFAEARALGISAKPVLIGPVTYLTLGKVQGPAGEGFDRFSLLDNLVSVYEEILTRLAASGAEWVQIDEPVFSLDLSEVQKASLESASRRLAAAAGTCRLMVATYFGPLHENLPMFLNLPVAGLHYDAVRGGKETTALIEQFPVDKVLSLGVVDGRNIWRNEFDHSLTLLRRALGRVGPERLWVAPSCSLLHVPISLAVETDLEADIKSWLSFADEKLGEVRSLRNFLLGVGNLSELEANRAAHAARRSSPRIHNPAVQSRLSAMQPGDEERNSAFPIRQSLQRAKLKLPLFPTTTIGSFPQTAEVRAARAKWKKGELSQADYEAFLKGCIRDCVKFQDEIGIDLPVHGEFERTDMVEYFGEQLDGFALTLNGWVQSYGTRCVKPPIIFGDVSRPRPMTTAWTEYAQTLTTRPMKGMLTGPVTILQWSFVRDDQPREQTARQISLAIRDEVLDLEALGTAAIQIDEPALREGLPLRQRDWAGYLRWAVQAFRLCSCGVRDETQIHTHMCYSEFNDILPSIAALDADVITIETSRSHMELLAAFVDFKYPNEIGPGVYDIHSPRVPEVAEIRALIQKAAAVIPTKNLWVNPDCGLKTRGWAEVRSALERMVQAARDLREAAE
jgi:5-methyltetrahydropteroyltriglutamate--homocysteine methyltransferase